LDTQLFVFLKIGIKTITFPLLAQYFKNSQTDSRTDEMIYWSNFRLWCDFYWALPI